MKIICYSTGGRLAWAAVSDAIGRQKTFYIFTLGSIPLYLFLPSMVDSVVSTGSAMPLYGFCLSTAAAISMMGGVYAILPAYEADLFGTKFAGAVHGRMLLFSSCAALAGPYMLLTLRSIAEKAAITDLLTKVCMLELAPLRFLVSFGASLFIAVIIFVLFTNHKFTIACLSSSRHLLYQISPEKFQATFGAPMDSAMEMLAAKSLSISKLLVLAPPGTIDPTPHLYDTTMYALSGLMAVAVVAHGLVRPLPVLPIPPAANVIDVQANSTTGSAPAAATEVVEKEETKVGDRLVK